MKFGSLLLVTLAPLHASMLFTAGTMLYHVNDLVDSCSQSDSSPVLCGYPLLPLDAFSSRGTAGWLFADAAADWPLETGDSISARASFAGNLTVTGRSRNGILAMQSVWLESAFSTLEVHMPPNHINCSPAFSDLGCFTFTYGVSIPISASARAGISEASDVRAAFYVLYISVLDFAGNEIKTFSYNDGYASDILNVGPLPVPEPGYRTPIIGFLLITSVFFGGCRRRSRKYGKPA